MIQGSEDFSFIGLFLRADLVVKTVMIVLILASIWCWAIIFEKITRIRRLNKSANEFEDRFWSGQSLEDLFKQIGPQPTDPMSSIFVSGMREWARSLRASNPVQGLQARIERVMTVTLGREMEDLEKYMSFLASVGSTATFAGLFGTVWGIMSSFQAIAVSQNTSLAVVAPGIAEALLATALGLVAAIPAVVAYNKISNDLNRYAKRLEAFTTEFSSILSRRVEEKAA
ncbi:MAG: protein TolQ [Alphaproteobacteria bacterium]|nr:protein TolQ [Alphaproteobacteria bacterium]MDP3532650.1 protein TolQ [Alphaproteobacteria bacterium]